ncbi:MAG: hypothetical protein PS018_11490 [bacterium]|nr:hypothetical protein [bacterium]
MTIVLKLIAFFGSAAGKYALIGLVAGGFALGLRQQGYNAASRKCEFAAKQREIEIRKRDARIGELSAKADERNQIEQDKDRKKDDEFQRKLEEELAKRPAAARCTLTEPDRLRLR